MTRRLNSAGQAALPVVGDLDQWLRNELRSDHAGEAGAVSIYRGILAVSRNDDVRRFAREHLATEEEHLAFFDRWLQGRDRSLLLPLWRLAGWLLGVVAAAAGARGVFLTVDAVETFVVAHYQQQIDALHDTGQWPEVRCVLETFQQDEDHHRVDALSRADDRAPGVLESAWCWLVESGSRLAVMAARVI